MRCFDHKENPPGEVNLPQDWKLTLQDAVQQGIAQGMAFMMNASEGRASAQEDMPQNLENLTCKGLYMLKGDFKLSKRFRERVQVGQDRSGRPLYKWAEGNTKQELQLNISKVILEAGLLDGFVSQSSAKGQCADRGVVHL